MISILVRYATRFGKKYLAARKVNGSKKIRARKNGNRIPKRLRPKTPMEIAIRKGTKGARELSPELMGLSQ